MEEGEADTHRKDTNKQTEPKEALAAPEGFRISQLGSMLTKKGSVLLKKRKLTSSSLVVAGESHLGKGSWAVSLNLASKTP